MPPLAVPESATEEGLSARIVTVVMGTVAFASLVAALAFALGVIDMDELGGPTATRDEAPRGSPSKPRRGARTAATQTQTPESAVDPAAKALPLAAAKPIEAPLSAPSDPLPERKAQ